MASLLSTVFQSTPVSDDPHVLPELSNALREAAQRFRTEAESYRARIETEVLPSQDLLDLRHSAHELEVWLDAIENLSRLIGAPMDHDDTTRAIDYPWLRASGFEPMEGSNPKQWHVLWVGDRRDLLSGLHDRKSLGVLIGDSPNDTWVCFLAIQRPDDAVDLIYLRHLQTRAEVIKLVEALTGRRWADPLAPVKGFQRRSH